MKLVVKNTFLEFELNDKTWGSDNCRRRASSFPANCARDAFEDCGDGRDTEVGSTDGSSTPSWTSELQYDASPTHTSDSDFKDLSAPKYGDWSVMDDREPIFTDSTWSSCLHNMDHACCPEPESDIQAPEFDFAAYHAKTIAQMTHSEVRRDDASNTYFDSFPDEEWPRQSVLARRTAHDCAPLAPIWNNNASAHAKHPSRRNQIESPQRGGMHHSPHSPHQSPKWNHQQQQTYNMVQPRSQTVAKTESKYTTIMLRNLPNDYTRDMLVDLLEAQGFGGLFNFLYLPFDFRKNAGLGYAFVNMSTYRDAKRAMKDLTGFRDWRLKSQKVLQVTWSTPLQGLWANVERYRNSPVMHPEVPEKFKPLLLADGVPVEFPVPTKTLQAPSTSASMWY